jgi:CheY-like chemotaxis protein
VGGNGDEVVARGHQSGPPRGKSLPPTDARRCSAWPKGARADLVISDYMMPVLDGAGLLLAMREIEAQRDIPYIIMSSMPEANVRERIAGYTAFVRKPFQLTAMVQLVASVLSVSRPET